jgi:hypothetical protein
VDAHAALERAVVGLADKPPMLSTPAEMNLNAR